jgi:1,2-diacylglycerol 3-alpha-glucosyltransferase
MRLVVAFDNLGPYHIARLTEVAKGCHLNVVQYRSQSAEYEWKALSSWPFHVSTVLERGRKEDFSTRKTLNDILEQANPDVIAVPGWSSKFSHLLMKWSVDHAVPMVLMSDSQKIDFHRYPWTEFVKSRLIKLFSAALVAGQNHRDYLVSLGFPLSRIKMGYDVVDNNHFIEATNAIRKNPERYRSA